MNCIKIIWRKKGGAKAALSLAWSTVGLAALGERRLDRGKGFGGLRSRPGAPPA
jgi:hypothetical protein